MPVSSVNKLSENTFLIVWEITETAKELQEMIHMRLQDWHASPQHHENRHWLASRLAILHHFRNEEVDLIKDSFNKPHLKVEEKDVFVSITHSFDKAAVIVSDDHPVSLDMEKIDARIDRVKHKFCSPSELQMAKTAHHPEKVLTLIWAAKETLYKWYGKKELDFKEHIQVHAFPENPTPVIIQGSIKKNGYAVSATIYVRQTDRYLLTWIA